MNMISANIVARGLEGKARDARTMSVYLECKEGGSSKFWGCTVTGLVERFDIEPFSDFQPNEQTL